MRLRESLRSNGGAPGTQASTSNFQFGAILIIQTSPRYPHAFQLALWSGTKGDDFYVHGVDQVGERICQMRYHGLLILMILR